MAENDVWRSADGQGWELVTASAAFAARVFHQAVSYGGSLWVISGREGYDLSANPPPAVLGIRIRMSGGRGTGPIGCW